MAKKQTQTDENNNNSADIPEPVNELEDYLNSLGASGTTEVSLYKVDPNGKQGFLTTGPISQMTESYVQMTFGAGDYIARGRVNGRAFGSKPFTVLDPPGRKEPVQNHNGEMERLRAEIEQERLQVERDRQLREQRNHELFLETLRHNNGGSIGTSLGDLVMALKNMRDMAEPQHTNPQELLNQSLETIQRIDALRGAPASNGQPVEWWQAAIGELGRLADKIIPYAPQLITALAAKPEPPASLINPPPVPLSLPAPAPAAGEPAAAAVPTPDPPAGAVSPAPAAPDPPVDEFQTYKKQLLQMALPLALAGSSAELYAELAFDQMRKGDIGILRLFEELLAQKDFAAWFEILQKLDSAIETQRDWFSRFYDSVRAEYAALQEEQQHAQH